MRGGRPSISAWHSHVTRRPVRDVRTRPTFIVRLSMGTSLGGGCEEEEEAAVDTLAAILYSLFIFIASFSFTLFLSRFLAFFHFLLFSLSRFLSLFLLFDARLGGKKQMRAMNNVTMAIIVLEK